MTLWFLEDFLMISEVDLRISGLCKENLPLLAAICIQMDANFSKLVFLKFLIFKQDKFRLFLEIAYNLFPDYLIVMKNPVQMCSSFWCRLLKEKTIHLQLYSIGYISKKIFFFNARESIKVRFFIQIDCSSIFGLFKIEI